MDAERTIRDTGVQTTKCPNAHIVYSLAVRMPGPPRLISVHTVHRPATCSDAIGNALAGARTVIQVIPIPRVPTNPTAQSSETHHWSLESEVCGRRTTLYGVFVRGLSSRPIDCNARDGWARMSLRTECG